MPSSFVNYFSKPGRYSFEAAFGQRARRYRRSNRIAVGLSLGFGLGVGTAVVLPVSEPVRFRIALLSAAMMPLALLLHLSNLRLRCPSCRRKLIPARGHYCP